MADARVLEMLDSIAIQVSPHRYRPVIESMFYDDVVNSGRLYTLRCFTSVMMIKYAWGKDYIRFEYKKFMKRLMSDLRRHHPRDVTSTDLPASTAAIHHHHPVELFDLSRHRLHQHQHPVDFDSSIHQLHHYHPTTDPTRCQTTDQTRRHHHTTRRNPKSNIRNSVIE